MPKNTSVGRRRLSTLGQPATISLTPRDSTLDLAFQRSSRGIVLVRLRSVATGQALTATVHGDTARLMAPVLPSPSADPRYQLSLTSGQVAASRLVTIPPGQTVAETVSLDPRHESHAKAPASPASLSAGPAVTPPSCPSGADSWNGSTSAAWETGTNWSLGSPPTTAQTACISANGPVDINSAVAVTQLILSSGQSLAIQTGSLTLTGSGADVSAVEGSLTVTTSLSISGELENFGAVTNNGQIAVTTANGSWTQDAGTESGNHVLIETGADLAFTGSGAGGFEVFSPSYGSVTVGLSGNLAAGQLLQIDSEEDCNSSVVTVNAAGSFTSAGTIAFDQHNNGCSGNTAKLTVPAGDTFTSTGTLESVDPSNTTATTDEIVGAVVSSGTFSVGTATSQVTWLVPAGETFVDQGAGAVAAGATLLVSGVGAGFTAGSSGALVNGGSVIVTAGGGWTQGDGSVSGNHVLLENGSSMDFTGSGAGFFEVFDPAYNSVTSSLAGNLVAGQTYQIDSEQNCNSSLVTVNAPGSFSSGGTISFDQHNNGCGGNTAKLVLPAGDTLTSSGTINSIDPSNTTATTDEIVGNVVSTGTFTVGTPTSQVTWVVPTGSTFTNQGTATISSGATLSIAGTFTDGSGSLTDNATIAVIGTWVQDSATESAHHVLLENGSTIHFGGTGAGTFEAFQPQFGSETVSVAGDIASGQTLQIDAEANCNAAAVTVNASATFSNAGTITFAENDNGCGGNTATLVIPPSATLTSTGTISAPDPSSSKAAEDIFQVQGQVVSSGTVVVGTATTVNSGVQFQVVAGGSFVNDGSMTVDTGAVVRVLAPGTSNPAAQFTDGPGGTISNQGQIAAPGGVWEQGAGTESGNHVLIETGADLAFTGSGAGGFEVFSPSYGSVTVGLSGNLAAGQLLQIDSEEDCNSSVVTVNAAGSFTSAGTIAFDQHNNGCSGNTAKLTVPAGDTFTSTGTLESVDPSNTTATTDEIVGAVVSSGTFSVGTATSQVTWLVPAGETFVDQGAGAVAAGATLLVSGVGAGFTAGSSGALVNGGSVIVTAGGGWTQGDGSVSGNHVLLENGSSMDFTGSGAGFFEVFDPAYNSVTSSLAGNLVAGQTYQIDSEQNCNSSLVTVNAPGSFSSGGTISFDQHNNGCGGNTAKLVLPAGDTLTSSGTINSIDPSNTTATTDEIVGNVVSTGTFTVGTPTSQVTWVVPTGSTFTNQGTATISSGATLSIAGGPTGQATDVGSFVNAAGSLTDNGTVTSLGKFVQGNATAVGNHILVENGSTMDFGGNGAGTFEVFDPHFGSVAATLLGNIAAAQTLQIDEENNCNATSVDVSTPSSLSNAGSIVFSQHNNGCSGQPTELALGGTLTNTASGVITTAEATLPAPYTISGNLDNHGIIAVSTVAGLTVSGTLIDEPGSTSAFDVQSDTTTPLLNAGGAVLNGTIEFVTSPSATQQAGAMLQPVSVSGNRVGSFDSEQGKLANNNLLYVLSTSPTAVLATLDQVGSVPAVYSVSPTSGPDGTSVTVNGSGFGSTAGATVSFGSTIATTTFVSSTQLTAVAPSGLSGAQRITVAAAGHASSNVAAPTFTYSTTVHSQTGTLALTVEDAGLHPVSNAIAVVVDPSTDNPVAVLTTTSAGTATGSALPSGVPLEVEVLAAPPPDGPASASTELAGTGTTPLTLTLPVTPLFTSDPSALAPNGSAEATWPDVLPTPGTPVSGGTVGNATTFGIVDFQLTTAASNHYLLAADPQGTHPFCVDGDWTLTLSDSTSSTPITRTGSGCPGTAVLDLSSLGLTSGTSYGGELTLTAPAGATTYGTTNIYLIPAPGTLSNIRAVRTTSVAPAQLAGSQSLEVGQSGTLNVLLGGFPIPGATGYHAIFGFDSTGIAVTNIGFPAGWGGGIRNNFANGDAGFLETTSSNPSTIGGTVLTLDVTCLQAGSWPVSFTGDYWLPSFSAGYTDSVQGAPTVTCTTPPAASTATPIGASVDHTDGSVVVTLNGTGLSGATGAELLDSTGTTVASATGLTADPSGALVTARFATAPPGVYDLRVLQGISILATTTGTPYQVAPALPLFSVHEVDVENNIPGIATTHIWNISNQGTVDGTGIFVFTFPSYVNPEPTLDLAGAPTGTEKLMGGLTDDGWVEYVAVPVAAGTSADVAWTDTIPPCAVFGTALTGCTDVDPPAPPGMATPVTVTLSGQYTAPEWSTASTGTYQAIVDQALATGMDDFTSAFKSVLGLGSASLAYLTSLPYANLAQAITYVGQSIMHSVSQGSIQTTGQQQTVAAPAPTTDVPAPPVPSSAAQGADTLNDPTASSFGDFTFNTAEAVASNYGVKNPGPTPNGSAFGVEASGSTVESFAGAATTYRDGSIAPVVTVPTAGTTPLAATAANWLPASNVNASTWTSHISEPQTVQMNINGGQVFTAALPFLQSADGNTVMTAHVFASDPPEVWNPNGPINTETSAQIVINQGWPIVSNAFPTPTSFAVETGFALLGLTFIGASFPAAVAIGVGGVLLTGVAQMMVQYANSINTQNHNVTDHHTVTSEDPNAIVASPVGVGAPNWVTSQPITYMVRFQNEPTATVEVHNVTVTLPLDPNLDPASVQPGDSSFSGTEFALDPLTKTITWTLPNVDLPPDTAPPNGEGWVSFTATPKADTAHGTQISEQANVFFDYNPPLATTPLALTVDATAATTTPNPIPAVVPGGSLKVSWPAASGSVPVGQYIVFLSKDGGPFEAAAETTGLSTSLNVVGGHRYGIAVQVVDAAGLAGPVPTEAQRSFDVTLGGMAAALTPARILDTRSGNGASGPVKAGQTVKLQVEGRGGVPASGVAAVVLNVTVTQPTAAGYVTVWPDGATRPPTSALNFSPGETIPNLVIAPVGADGTVDLYNGANGTIQLVADVSGWFSTGTAVAGGLTPLTPARHLGHV